MGIFDRCRNACASGGCFPEDGWSACMDARSNALTCIGECLGGAPCSLPRDVLERYCVVRAPQVPAARCGSQGVALPASGGTSGSTGSGSSGGSTDGTLQASSSSEEHDASSHSGAGTSNNPPPGDCGWNCLDADVKLLFELTWGPDAQKQWATEHQQDVNDPGWRDPSAPKIDDIHQWAEAVRNGGSDSSGGNGTTSESGGPTTGAGPTSDGGQTSEGGETTTGGGGSTTHGGESTTDGGGSTTDGGGPTTDGGETTTEGGDG